MALSKYIQAQRFSLAVGISTTDTSITLSSFDFPDGTAIASGDLGAINYGTLEPATTREEIISFTGITSNSDGTVTLTGVTRGLGFGAVDTYSEQSDLKVQHGAGATFIISNNPAFYDRFVNKFNNEEVTGTLTVPTPTASGHAATKAYVDATAIGGATIDNVIVAATAGESVAAGDLVYYDDTDNEWKKTDADTVTTIDNVLLGIAQGSGSNGVNISGGVLTFGVDANQTGLTVGVKLYASDTAGEISESAGTNEKIIGWSKSATEVYFDPYHGELPSSGEKAAMSGVNNAPSSTNQFVTTDDLSDDTFKSPQVVTFTSSGTWTKDAGLKYIVVEAVGAGGGGGRTGGDGVGPGGGGGGYARKLILASALGSSETVTIGTAGSGSSGSSDNATAGTDTTFGSHVTAGGGLAAGSSNGGSGGSATGGDVNVSGKTGLSSLNEPYSLSDGAGGGSFLGAGAVNVSFSATGVTATEVGGGGAGGNSTNSANAAGGAGFRGEVIVTEYYS